MVIGTLALIAGALVFLGLFDWFGRLPGDIRIEGERTRIYFPITSMILISIVLSAALLIGRRLL